MPYTFNDAGCHTFEKKRYRISNWPAYTESLRQRGDVTVWLSPEVEALWRAERRKTRGGQPTYSDLAITVCLTLGVVYKPPLRQTEGFVRSLVKLMGVDIRVPDFSTFSRRGSGLSSSPAISIGILELQRSHLRDDASVELFLRPTDQRHRKTDPLHLQAGLVRRS